MRDKNLITTGLLDYEHPVVRELHASLAARCTTKLDYLRTAHRHIVASVLPVYSLDEHQPVSDTLAKQRGSCSQRMACLEALARAHGIPTRVRALWVKGRFWRRRFPYVHLFFPKRVLLLWPEFFLDGQWLSFEELHAPVRRLATENRRPFKNDTETLFEAIETQAVDFFGRSTGAQRDCAPTDLSSWVVEDSLYFATRDDALAQYGSLHHSVRGRIFHCIFGDRRSV